MRSRPTEDAAAADRPSWQWWLAVVAVAAAGLVLRATNLDFDQGQHLHPDERHWSLTAAAMAAEPAPARHGTAIGPVLDWLDGQRSPANPYRGTSTFVYGGLPLAASRGAAGWLEHGAVEGAQPAAAVAHALNALGVPLLDDDGNPRFDDGYQVNLIGRLLSAITDSFMVVVVAAIGRRLGGRRVGLAAAVVAACSVMAIQHAHFMVAEPTLGLAAALTVLTTLRLATDGGRASVVAGWWAGAAAGLTVAVKLSGGSVAIVPFGVGVVLLARGRRRSDVLRLAAMVAGAAVALRVAHPAAFEGLGLAPSGYWNDVREAQAAATADVPPGLQWAGRSPLDPLRWLLVYTIGPGTSLAALAGVVALIRRRARVGPLALASVLAAVALPMAVVLPQFVTTGRYFVPMLPALFAVAGYGLVALAELPRWAAAGDRARRLGPALAMGLLGLSGLWAFSFVDGVHGHVHTRVAASRWIAAHVPDGAVLSAQAWDDALPIAVEGVDPNRWRSEQLDLFGPDSVDKVRRLADQLERIDVVVESSPRVWAVVPRLPARFPSTMRFFEALDDGSLGYARVATFASPPRLGPFRLDTAAAEEAFSVYDHPEVRIWRRERQLSPDELLAQLDPVAAATALPVGPTHATANGSMLRPDEQVENARIGTFVETFDTDTPAWLQTAGWFVLLELLGLAAFALVLPFLRGLPDAGLGMAKGLGLLLVMTGTFLAVGWAEVPLTRSLVAVVTGVVLSAGVIAARRHRSVLAELWQTRRRTMVLTEATTIVAFLVLLWVRAANPDLWHPHRSGEKPFELEMLTATLRTRSLPPYDPWYSGGTLNYYYGGYLLLAGPARLLRTAPALVMNLAPAVVAAVASGAASTAGAALRSLRSRSTAADGDVARRDRRAGSLAVLAVLALPSASIVPGIAERLSGRASGAFDWWELSRTFPVSPIVTEFPAWSLLFSDVHPHVLDLGLVLAVVALAIGLHRVLVDGGSTFVVGAGAALAGTVAGATRVINTWDLPLAVGLVALAPLAAWRMGANARRCLFGALVAAGAAWVVWKPYVDRADVTDAGLELEEIGSPFRSWALHWGFWAAVTVTVVAAVVVARREQIDLRRLAGAGLAAGGFLLLVGGLVPDRAALATCVVLAALSAAGAELVRRLPGRPGAAPLVALALGWTLVAGVEVVSVINDFLRMNTVFKGWFQAWVLLALGSAAAIADLGGGPRRAVRSRVGAAVASVTGPRAAVGVGAALVVAFVVLAVPARLDDRVSPGGLSLDGMAYLDGGLEVGGPPPFDPGDDRPLIAWLRAHGDGLATVAEIPGPDYAWNGRMSVNTGLPTILSWPYHQSQQRRRHGTTIEERRLDADALYTSGDAVTITEVLQRYDVRFVVFGTVERAAATEASEAALRSSSCVTVELEVGALWVASVDQGCLSTQPGGLPVRTARSP